ncbi:ABC transporter permease subunit [Frigoriflavimonas asaccharolytica]|uniref:ABC-type transport system involved in multi-copper enzyme maturation permease subunit n=1 Tax=Frigoriflavimonas asaccharolytica TaxID=2735899 RepID=A0A8J8K4I6_9FLAO|nr:ABC transporter permease subunit [Frigoriflavimonas asaccharolytica]NRS91785.1 ABC-type transport system involved in multi-copper enzyme maturation permease subunit [Frigoriflavimonas asaccharolytica]
MIRLLKLELLKNLNYRPFKVFTAIYFIVLVALLFIGLVDIKLTDSFTLNLKEEGIYNFPGIWNFTTYIVAIFKIFLGLIIIFSITQEFNNRMFKQNTIDGLSREEFVLSKVITIGLFSAVSTLVVFLITLFLGFQYSESTDYKLVTEEMYMIGDYFLKLFAFFSFLLFLSVLLRKSMFVFLSFFGWWIIEGILGGIESFMKMRGVHGDILLATKDKFFFSHLLPLESMSELIPNPLLRLKIAEKMGAEYTFNYPFDSLIACIVWTIIFITGTYFLLKKRDW